MHHGPPRAVHGDAVLSRRAIAGQQQDHLQPRERLHDGAVGRAEAREALRRHEREIHARLEHEPLFGRAVHEIALGVAHVVGDGARVLAHQDEGGMTREVPAEARQARREARPEQQRRRADRARRAHDQPGAHAMLARRPLRRRALRSGRLRHDAYVERLVGADPQHFRAGHDLDTRPLGARQLNAIRALLRLIGTAEIAKARAATAFHIDRELLDGVAGRPAPHDEQPVVVVDQGLLEQVHAVLLGILR